jgi:L-ribulose-5-phosphate 4-epimerase
MYDELKAAVCEANRELKRQNLVIYSWGNVSGIDRAAGIVVIKPSGVPYDELTSDTMVIVDLEGKVVEGEFNPSSDTPTHLELYRAFETVGSICHTHSRHATMWAQACRSIPCFGTTHADYYFGEVPLTDSLAQSEITNEYEINTGRVIVRRFANLDPEQMPAVLVANHGPFTWGASPAQAVESAVTLEEVAAMAIGTLAISPYQSAINQNLLDKHYLRKHGEDAYYGQP